MAVNFRFDVPADVALFILNGGSFVTMVGGVSVRCRVLQYFHFI